MPSFNYPPVGYHFSVAFELPQNAMDTRFQEVSGLNVEMEMDSYKEAGNNRFTWQLPVRTKYEDLTLKRGIVASPGIITWVRAALEGFVFVPANIMISLLNEDHAPLYNWYIINALPKKWQISNFNAQESSVAIETLVLSYQYFNIISI